MSKSNQRRVVGLDVHPDSFAGAILAGRDPASAQVIATSTRVELKELEHWAERQTSPEDTLVLEASGNAFAVAGRLRALGRQVTILDSHQAGKIGKVYCATDRVDAVKIARIYLSGLSAQVWQPDAQTLEQREVFSAYQGVVKESTRLQQQLKCMLNEHCVRLPKGFRLCHPTALDRLAKVYSWSPVQTMLLSQLHRGVRAARGRRSEPRRHMAGEILSDPEMLRLARPCGLSLVTIYGVQAAIGDIQRFAHSNKLVAYFGLNPSICQSGNYEGGTALKRHGRGPLRALLIQSAPRNSSKSPTRCKSGAWPSPPAAAVTRPPWPWRENSASPSGTSSRATSSAPSNASTLSRPSSANSPPPWAWPRSMPKATRANTPSSKRSSPS
jgi:transposase